VASPQIFPRICCIHRRPSNRTRAVGGEEWRRPGAGEELVSGEAAAGRQDGDLFFSFSFLAKRCWTAGAKETDLLGFGPFEREPSVRKHIDLFRFRLNYGFLERRVVLLFRWVDLFIFLGAFRGCSSHSIHGVFYPVLVGGRLGWVVLWGLCPCCIDFSPVFR
jgi:hypothetical protein